jgi:hypothetical protein
MRVGPVTMVEGHLDSIEAYTQIMEDPACQLGTVRLYADDFGIQMCGSAHPDVTPEQITRALASAPSGDWREDDYRLFAIALVNTPGYAHYEQTGDTVTRMVAAIPPPAPGDSIDPERAFFDVPLAVLAAGNRAEAECTECDEDEPPEARKGLSATGIHDLALLDAAMKVRVG